MECGHTYRYASRQTTRQVDRRTQTVEEHWPNVEAVLQLEVIAFIAIHLLLSTIVNPGIAVAAAYRPT